MFSDFWSIALLYRQQAYKQFETKRVALPTDNNVDEFNIPRILHFVNLSPGFPGSPKNNIATKGRSASWVWQNIQNWKDAMESVGWKIMVWDNAAVDMAYPSLVPFLKTLPKWSW